MIPTTYKIIQTGHIIEIYEYEKFNNLGSDIQYGENEKEKEEKPKEKIKDPYSDYKNHKDSIQRTRNNLRRLINSNFDSTSLFVTITYGENFQDVDKSNEHFKNFMKRLRYKYGKEGIDFKYVSNIEFQDRGAIHYHTLMNIPHDFTKEEFDRYEEKYGKNRKPKRAYVMENELSELWGNGFVFVKPVDNVDNAGAYLLKYMRKELNDARLIGKKKYFYSRNLNKPNIITGEDALLWVNTLDMQVPVFNNEYESEYTGKVRYREFNLERIKPNGD